MKTKFNRFTFCPDDYKERNENTQEEYVNEYAMYEDIKSFIRLAVKNGYQCRVWHDSYTICIDYNYQDESLSSVSLEWLGEHEYIVNDLEEGAECVPTGGEA